MAVAEHRAQAPPPAAQDNSATARSAEDGGDHLRVSAEAAAGISVTSKAVQKIRAAFEKMGVADLKNAGLRLGVLGGGCSGLSYQFKFDTKPRPTDKIFEFDGVQVFIDAKSILYLHGMTLDYKETLMQSGFVFENPNAKKSCGCGTSFSS